MLRSFANTVRKQALAVPATYARGLSSTAGELKCFKVDVRDDGVAIVTIDCPGASMNSLTAELQEDFPALLSTIRDNNDIKAVVLKSAKKGCFVAGADINQLTTLTSVEDGEKISA